jgi:hypothetical protein
MQIRIIFDTCVVRHFVGGSFTIDKDLFINHKPRLLVSLSDLALSELALDLLDHSLDFAKWTPKAKLLNHILHKERPVFPSGNEFLALSEIKPSKSYHSEQTKVFFKASWEYLKNAKCDADLNKGKIIKLNRSRHKIALISHAQTVLQQGREDWIKKVEYLRDYMLKNGLSAADELRVMKIGLSQQKGYSKDASQRLEAGYRFLAFHVHKAMKKDFYKPSSKKNRNDGLDWQMSFYLGLPAIVCTNDKKFQKKIQDTDSRQANLVLTGEELVQKIKSNSIEKLFE